MVKTMSIALISLLSVLGLFLFGCAQQAAQVQYVCADGRTIVANLSLCPAAAGAAAVTTGGVAAPTLTLETELEVCAGMPEVQGQSLEDICIIGLAGKHENASLCRKVSSNQRTTCYMAVATVTDNADVCAEAGTQKDQCYQQYASTTSDISVCDMISDITYKDSCYGGLASKLGDATACDKIRSTDQKDSCYFNMAMRFRDTSYCNKITGSSQKQNCLQNLQQQTGEIVMPK